MRLYTGFDMDGHICQLLIVTPHLFHTDTNTIQTFQNTQKENSHGELKNYTIEVMEAELLGKY